MGASSTNWTRRFCLILRDLSLSWTRVWVGGVYLAPSRVRGLSQRERPSGKPADPENELRKGPRRVSVPGLLGSKLTQTSWPPTLGVRCGGGGLQRRG